MASHASILTKTWVVVFDGGRASAFENEGFDDAPNLKFVFGAEHDNPKSHEQGRDKPGRFETPMGGKAAVSSADLHGKEEARFVDAFLGDLEAAAVAGRFDRLVAIAPGALLSRLAEKAPKATGKLAATHAGDFAHAPTPKIERVFQDALKG